MFAATKEKGLCLGFPDVCITPVPSPTGQVPTPIPYPNTAACPTVQDACEKVYVSGALAIIKKSNYSSSVGDQAGSQGGVASGQTSGKVEYQMGSQAVKFEGSYAQRLTSMTTHNKNNTVGVHAVPSQTKVLIIM